MGKLENGMSMRPGWEQSNKRSRHLLCKICEKVDKLISQKQKKRISIYETAYNDIK